MLRLLGPGVGSLTRADCRLLITSSREKGLKLTTVKGIARTLSTLLSQAVEDEKLPAAHGEVNSDPIPGRFRPYRKCRRLNARPEPVFRQSSNAMAPLSSSNSIVTTCARAAMRLCVGILRHYARSDVRRGRPSDPCNNGAARRNHSLTGAPVRPMLQIWRALGRGNVAHPEHHDLGG